jgi:hypothetical protein
MIAMGGRMNIFFIFLFLLQIFKSDLGARAKADRCVSLVSKHYGELNLEAGSKMQLTAWLFGVTLL